MNREKHLVLSDRRRLAYAEFGRPDGSPVLYFHGAPSSRLEPLLVGNDVWSRAGLRIIAPDRPGIGQSDFLPGRGFSDWPRDVTALADALGLKRFAVLGNSGGGPYAAVCAAKIPERLSAAVIVSGGWQMNLPEAKAGIPFVNRLFLGLAAHAPPLCRLMLKAMGSSSVDDPEKELAKLKDRVPPADYAAFAKPGRIQALHEVMRECVRGGTKGAAWDLRLYMRPFDFELEEIRIPLKLYHGERDVQAPIALVRRMVARLPSAQLVTYPDDSHLSTLCNHVEQLAEAIIHPETGGGTLR
ncbi:MAG TPA: alpha/beta hydrolase [Candidatus Polarisedimenticolia bacterium]|nr:alpha/beta hydrolase [Candidatus Polarisedimenticolia bacterium]